MSQKFTRSSGGNGQSYFALSGAVWLGAAVAVGKTAATSYNGYNTIAITDRVSGQNFVYIFTRTTLNGNWTVTPTISTLTLNGVTSPTDAYFGNTLFFSNQTLIAGDVLSGFAGSVWLLQYNPASTCTTSCSKFQATQQIKCPLNTGNSDDNFGMGIAVGDNFTFVVAASPISSTLNTYNGLYIYSRVGYSGVFTLQSSINTYTTFTLAPFLSMITNPSPQILVGGSTYEEVFKGKSINNQ
jgi:hypothetical protein